MSHPVTRIRRAWQVRRGRTRLQGTPLFDPDWYRAAYPDVAATSIDPARHYLAWGADEGRDPGPGFSTSGYQLAGPVTGNPLLHYLTHGKAAGRAALPIRPGQQVVAAGAPVVIFVAHQVLAQPFGAERSLLDMLDLAGAAGIAVVVVVPQVLDPAYLAALEARATAVHIIPDRWYRPDHAPHPVTLAAMVALIRTTGAVELHQNTLAPATPLAAARAAGIPGTLWLRELPAQDAELCARLGVDAVTLRADLLAAADRFVANSAATEEWLDPAGTLAAQGRLVVVPNTVDAGLAALPFAPGDPVRVGLVGSLVSKKGIADFIAMARAFHAGTFHVRPFQAQDTGAADEKGSSGKGRGRKAEFVLIGPASADLAALRPLPAGVHHAGPAPDPVAALAGLDVLVSLSRFAESHGRTVAEALTAGRPVICYDRGTPPALIGASGAGHIVPADDPAAAARALHELLATPGALHAASQAARARAAELATMRAAVEPATIWPDALARPVPMP